MLPVNESDWKLFRKRLPEWQERCMEQLAESYAALLAGPGKASDKFWELEKRLRKDKKARRCRGRCQPLRNVL